MRNRIHVVVDLGIALHLAQVIPRAVILVKRDPQAPDIALPHSGNRLLAQRLGPTVKTARQVAKGKIRHVRLRETADGFGRLFDQGAQCRCGEVFFHPSLSVYDHFSPGIDAAGRDMAPRNPGGGAGLGDGLGEQRVALKRVGFVGFAGVHIRLPGIAGGIDEKRRLPEPELLQ